MQDSQRESPLCGSASWISGQALKGTLILPSQLITSPQVVLGLGKLARKSATQPRSIRASVPLTRLQDASASAQEVVKIHPSSCSLPPNIPTCQTNFSFPLHDGAESCASRFLPLKIFCNSLDVKTAYGS